MSVLAAAEPFQTTPFVVLRLFEVAAVLVWALGWVMVRRFGATKFLFGLYLGTTAWFMWDWIFTDSWFLNLSYDSRSILLYTLDGRPEPLWSPASYGFFFGIATLVILRYRTALRNRFGRWFYLVVPLGMAVFDVAVEGLIVSGLDIYRYGYRDEWTILGVPYTNIVWVILIEVLLISTLSAFADLQHKRGQLAVLGDPDGPTQKAGKDEPWVIAALTFSVTAAAVYLGTTAMAFVLEAVDPWS